MTNKSKTTKPTKNIVQKPSFSKFNVNVKKPTIPRRTGRGR